MRETDKQNLEIEEAAAILSTGQRAAFVLAENAVTVTGYGIVGRVPDEFRQELVQEGDEAPESAKFLEDEQDGIRARE